LVSVSVSASWVSISASSDIEVGIEAVEALGSWAVKVKPPDTSEDLLIEYGAIGTQKSPWAVAETLMPHLAPGLDVGIHTVIPVVTDKAGFRGHIEDGVIDLRFTYMIEKVPIITILFEMVRTSPKVSI
jgi:hypothetical protein